MLAATVPLTYWMVFPLFAAVVVAMVAVLVGSYRKILAPSYERWVHQLFSANQADASAPALRLMKGGGTDAEQRTQLRRAA